MNGLNTPSKRCRVASWIKKQEPTVWCLQETHLTCKGIHGVKVKGERFVRQVEIFLKRAGIAILISDKTDI